MASTLRDVAQRAGVSEAAASTVLNKRTTFTRVSTETRARIVSAAQELNYRPNVMARALARRRSDTIMLVPPDAWCFPAFTPFTGEMLRGVSVAAHATDYDLSLRINPHSDPEQEASVLMDGRADGALLQRPREDPLVQLLAQRGFPCVLLYSRSTDPALWSVDCDNILGGAMATDHLLDLGHRRILYLAAASPDSDALDRCEGYRQALHRRGVTFDPELVVPVTWRNWSEAEITRVKTLLLGPDAPTAAFTWYDEAAFRLIPLARELGLRVPQDLSIVGFDSTELCDQSDPPLTSVRQPVREMASDAFTMLLQRLRGETVLETQRLFEPVLDQRASCVRMDR